MNGKVLFKSYYHHAFLPAKEGDVGHDLHTVIRSVDQRFSDLVQSVASNRDCIVIWPKQTRLIHTGIRLSMPDDVWVMITERSSTLRKKMMVLGGIIDSGYQGELLVNVYNFGFKPRVIYDGDRLAQAIFIPAIRPELEKVGIFHPFPKTQRGNTGFGSTGT